MAADVVDDQGQPVRGAVGELAIRGPWPGMTRGFWGDPERYVDTYFSRVPGLWVHGDWAQIDEDGYWYILGRSDDTIKVATGICTSPSRPSIIARGRVPEAGHAEK